jgi:MFS family permease
MYKKKKGSFNKEKVSFVPSIHQLMNNKPFVTLIIPWICDVSIITIYSSMLPFFLNVIINPQKYCRENRIPLKDIQCSTNYYLGLSISVFFICCIISCNVWHYLVSRFGKIFCWRIFSLLCLFPFSLYLFCGVGTTNLLMFAAIVTSFPSGGSYLNDVVVSDAIEYDEFTSGKRTEGIYTVCSAFIPKFVSLFAQAIPLSLLSIIGFIPTENGYVHSQPLQVVYYLKTIFAIVPMILCVLSFYYKLKFPIKDEINEQIKNGIELQKSQFDLMKKDNVNYYKIYDPVYETKYISVIPNTDEFNVKNSIKTKDFLNHFISYRFLFLIYKGELKELKKILKAVIVICSALGMISILILLYTFEYLSEQKYSFIPITDLFVITALVIIIILFYLKLSALNRVLDGEFELDNRLVKLFIFAKMKNNRELIFQEDGKDGMKSRKEKKLE